jgi:acyl-CoA synthetase (NDP forming)
MQVKTSLAEQFGYIFNPRSVAIIGASNTFGTWGFGILNRVLASSVPRKIYPVNKNLSEIRGMKVYSSVTEIPDPVDFAVIAIPARHVPGVMQQCVEKGVKAAIVISSGFSEVDQQGAELEQEVVRIARQGGIRFVGPNCMGHFDAHSDFSTLGFIGRVREGPIGFISQSGTFGTHMIRNGLEMGVGFSKFVGSGNEADLHLEDYVEYLAQDEDTRVIAAYIEGLREGQRFFQLAKQITRKKPIVVLKSGKTRGGTRAAKSHTAALAGSDAVFDSMCKQAGIIRVKDDDELFDVVVALLHLPLPAGRRVGVLTEGGGIGVVAADACEEAGLELASFSPATFDKLNSILPDRWSHGNPVDTVAAEFVTLPCLWAILEDENVDAAMLIGGVGTAANLATLSRPPDWIKELLDKFIQEREEEELKGLDTAIELMHKLRKPMVITTLLTETIKSTRIFKKLQENGLQIYPSPERAARVLSHIAWYNEYLSSLPQAHPEVKLAQKQGAV